MFKRVKNLKKINWLKIFNLEKLQRQSIYIIVLAVFIVANFLLSTISLRLDLSNGRAYTLSSSTKKVLKQLDGIVNIKFFVSSDLPGRLLPLKSDVTDLLNEYQKEGRGKIIVKVVDPKKNEESASQASDFGVPQLQFSQLENDKYAVTEVYFGAGLSYGGKKDVIAQATDLGGLEYNLTAAIYKLTKKELPKIGILGYDQNFNLQDDPISTLKKVLEQQFAVEYVTLSGELPINEIDQSYKTLLIFDNKKNYSDEEIKLIKNYLDKKGKAVFFVDGLWVEDTLQTMQASHNLFNLIGAYGINIDRNLVLSTSAQVVNFGTSSVNFLTPYYFWIKTTGFNQKSSYFSNISQLVFPWVSSLQIKKKEGIEINELVKTTKQSWQQKDSFILDPQTIPTPQEKDLKEFLLIALAKIKNRGEIVVIPSSRLVLDKFFGNSLDNLEFTINLLNDLASGGALSGIRQRSVVFYPLPELSNNQKDIFKYINILLLPGLLTAYAAFKLTRKKTA